MEFLRERLSDPIFLEYWASGMAFVGIYFFPKSRWTAIIAVSFVVLAGLLFSWMVFSEHPNPFQVVTYNFMTLEGWTQFVNSPSGRLGVFLQLVTKDVLVGYWISNDAKDLGVPEYIRAPYLILFSNFSMTLLAVYLVFRFWKTKQIPLTSPLSGKQNQ
jgi:hypothetical protein